MTDLAQEKSSKSFREQRREIKRRAHVAVGKAFAGDGYIPSAVRNFSTVTFREIGRAGQFGNQLFQISAVLGYAHTYGCRPVLPVWHCKTSDRRYDSYFPLVRKFYGTNRGALFRETDFSYSRIPFIFNVNLLGFFQSEKYFEPISLQIKELFAEPEIVSRRLDNYCLQHGLSDFNALHIRCYTHANDRGAPLQMLPDAYFNNALQRLESDRMLVVATDDKTVAAKMISRCASKQPIHLLSLEDPLLEFFMLSRAKQIAISNSSFSWWAAYLGAEKDLVLAPDHRRWFTADKLGSCALNTNDIYPSAYEEVQF